MAGPKFLAPLLLAGGVLSITPAAAQFGTIFGDSPRPPANVPGRQAYPAYPAPPPGDPRAPATAPPVAPAAIQSQPLPPPPGIPPAQRPPRGAPQPATTAPQPGDEVISALPVEKIANPTAVFSGLDKITG